MNKIQYENIKNLEIGKVMTNSGVTTFKLFGRYYTTNFNRKRPYSMDDKYWQIYNTPSPFWFKLKLLLTNKVKRLA